MATSFETAVQKGPPDKVEHMPEGRFGALKAVYGREIAILKPKLYSNALFRGVPKDSYQRREVAFYRLDRALRLGLVPETLLTTHKDAEASAQQFIHGAVLPTDVVRHLWLKHAPDRELRIAKFLAQVPKASLQKLVVLDLVANSGDRHGKNFMVDHNRQLWAVDNGISFGKAFLYYRNVVHRYGFLNSFDLMPSHIVALKSLSLAYLTDLLGDLLDTAEIYYTFWRAQFVLEHGSDLSYKTLSQGRLGKNGFPTYFGWFRGKMLPEATGSVHVLAKALSAATQKLLAKKKIESIIGKESMDKLVAAGFTPTEPAPGSSIPRFISDKPDATIYVHAADYLVVEPATGASWNATSADELLALTKPKEPEPEPPEPPEPPTPEPASAPGELKKPHVAYTKHSKTGKLVQVKAKGVKKIKPKGKQYKGKKVKWKDVKNPFNALEEEAEHLAFDSYMAGKPSSPEMWAWMSAEEDPSLPYTEALALARAFWSDFEKAGVLNAWVPPSVKNPYPEEGEGEEGKFNVLYDLYLKYKPSSPGVLAKHVASEFDSTWADTVKLAQDAFDKFEADGHLIEWPVQPEGAFIPNFRQFILLTPDDLDYAKQLWNAGQQEEAMAHGTTPSWWDQSKYGPWAAEYSKLSVVKKGAPAPKPEPPEWKSSYTYTHSKTPWDPYFWFKEALGATSSGHGHSSAMTKLKEHGLLPEDAAFLENMTNNWAGSSSGDAVAYLRGAIARMTGVSAEGEAAYYKAKGKSVPQKWKDGYALSDPPGKEAAARMISALAAASQDAMRSIANQNEGHVLLLRGIHGDQADQVRKGAPFQFGVLSSWSVSGGVATSFGPVVIRQMVPLESILIAPQLGLLLGGEQEAVVAHAGEFQPDNGDLFDAHKGTDFDGTGDWSDFNNIKPVFE